MEEQQNMAAALLAVQQHRGLHINSLLYFCSVCLACLLVIGARTAAKPSEGTELFTQELGMAMMGMEVMWRTWAE